MDLIISSEFCQVRKRALEWVFLFDAPESTYQIKEEVWDLPKTLSAEDACTIICWINSGVRGAKKEQGCCKDSIAQFYFKLILAVDYILCGPHLF